MPRESKTITSKEKGCPTCGVIEGCQCRPLTTAKRPKYMDQLIDSMVLEIAPGAGNSPTRERLKTLFEEFALEIKRAALEGDWQ